MSLVNIKINGQPYQVESGLTVLEAARKCGYVVPSLCASTMANALWPPAVFA